MRPIIVNSDYEILDGQHRLLAAKNLGVEIYYEIEEKLEHKDIILMNVAKSWAVCDYMNYFVKNHYPEYLKLDQFIKERNLSLSIALNLTLGRKRSHYDDFKLGKYVFDDRCLENIDNAWQTIRFIERINGARNSLYTKTARFWKALLILFSHSNFDFEQWTRNLGKHMSKVMIKATFEDYLKLFTEIYNHRSFTKIEAADLI